MHTESDVSIILIITILFIGIAGHTIRIMDMDIHRGTILSIILHGDGDTAGIRPIVVGDGDILPITAITALMAMEDITDMDMAVTIIAITVMEADITVTIMATIVVSEILTTTIMEKEDLPEQMF